MSLTVHIIDALMHHVAVETMKFDDLFVAVNATHRVPDLPLETTEINSCMIMVMMRTMYRIFSIDPTNLGPLSEAVIRRFRESAGGVEQCCVVVSNSTSAECHG